MSELMANVSCVAMRGRGVLITGAPGSGKSSLALALLDRGGELVATAAQECLIRPISAAARAAGGERLEQRSD